MAQRIAVVAALRWECRPVLQALRRVRRGKLGSPSDREFTVWHGESAAGAQVSVVQSGVGIEPAAQATRHLLAAERFDQCLSVGCAGALHGELPPGTLVIASEIVGAAKRYPVDAALRAALELACQQGGTLASCGGFLCSERALFTAAEKRDAHLASGALAVEMEGFGIAEAAEAAGVPFAAVRAILDDAAMQLPEAGDYMDGETGRPNWRVLARTLITRPGAVAELMPLGKAMNEVRRSLARFSVGYFG